MPQVPYRATPTVSPEGAAAPGFHVPVTADAFGANVGQAIEHLGGTLQRSGEELFNRALAIQEVQNRADADLAFTKYSEAAALEHENFRELRGQQAREGLQGHISRLEDIRQDIRGTLTNSQAQKFYDSESRGILRQSTFAAARHAGDEGKRYAIGSGQGVLDRLGQNVFSNYNDDDGFMDAVKKGSDIIRGTISPVSGWSPEQTDMEVSKWTSSMYSKRIAGMSKDEPQRAMTMLDDAHKKGLIREDDYIRLNNTVTQNARTVGAQIIVHKYMEAFNQPVPEGEVEPTYTGQLNKALAELRTVMPGDPVAEDMLRKGFHTAFNIRQAQVKQDIAQHTETLWTGLIQGGNIKTVQDLKNASPGASAAFDALPSREQAKWAGRINNYNASTEKVHNEHMMTIIKGMSVSDDPAQRIAFETLDPTDPKYKLNDKNIQTVLGWQKTARKGADKDYGALVKSVWGTMRMMYEPELRAMGVYSAAGGNEDKHSWFMGTLAMQMELWMDQHKGQRPTADQIRTEIAEPLMKATVPVMGWFGKYYVRPHEADPMRAGHVFDIPDKEWVKLWKSKAMSEGVSEPTDDEMRRAWILKQLTEERERQQTQTIPTVSPSVITRRGGRAIPVPPE